MPGPDRVTPFLGGLIEMVRQAVRQAGAAGLVDQSAENAAWHPSAAEHLQQNWSPSAAHSHCS